jgi:hypothetical protein
MGDDEERKKVLVAGVGFEVKIPQIRKGIRGDFSFFANRLLT